MSCTVCGKDCPRWRRGTACEEYSARWDTETRRQVFWIGFRWSFGATLISTLTTSLLLRWWLL